jgi:hypothetical protein
MRRCEMGIQGFADGDGTAKILLCGGSLLHFLLQTDQVIRLTMQQSFALSQAGSELLLAGERGFSQGTDLIMQVEVI